MLDFKKLTIEDAELLGKFYGSTEYESSEYSVGIKCFWNKFYPYEYAISKSGCPVVKYTEGSNTVFDMPIAKCNAAINSALDEIDEYCIKNYIVPVFSDVPESMLCLLAKRYNFTKIENFREAEDYVYKFEDLRDFKGKHYSGQRNHINKFKSLYTDYTYRPLKDGEDLGNFWACYYRDFDGSSQSALQEKEVAMAMVADCSKLSGFVSGCIEVGGNIAAISVAELRGDTAIIHIEKALTQYEGIYPLMVSEFLKHLPDNIMWVNREDDSSDRGLRISKLQYRPDHLVSKYVVLVQSELLYVEAIPTIKTDRLVLGDIEPCDAGAYKRLCLDDERNIYWGYDYRNDLEEKYRIDLGLVDSSADGAQTLPDDYFYQVAKNDFNERMCLNFAIRLDGAFIGEVVLYEADYKGSIEIGCRIFKEYGGHGYGAEAIAAAADWAIYGAGFRKVKAKCFKENIASERMLASFMKRAGEDAKYYYFEKNC